MEIKREIRTSYTCFVLFLNILWSEVVLRCENDIHVDALIVDFIKLYLIGYFTVGVARLLLWTNSSEGKPDLVVNQYQPIQNNT